MTMKERRLCRQGFLFTFELSNEYLSLKLLRVIPLRRVRLQELDYLRASSRREMFSHVESILAGGCWPSMPTGRQHINAPMYMLKKRRGGRIFLRLKPRFHYILRGMVGSGNRLDNYAKRH